MQKMTIRKELPILSRSFFFFFRIWFFGISSSSSSLTVLFTSALSSTTRPTATIQKNQNNPWKIPSTANVLSQDPLIYTIPNLLTEEECQAYIDYVSVLGSTTMSTTTTTTSTSASGSTTTTTRRLKRSNPPKVSLDRSKLWPLPFLSLGAGIPSILKATTTTTLNDPIEILQQAQMPIGIACLITLLLVIIAPTLIQTISDKTARTSLAMALNEIQDISFITPLVDRVTTLSGHSWEKWEAPVVTKYDIGAIFARHGDASPTLGSEWDDEGGQRVITCICYLNDLVVVSPNSSNNNNNPNNGDDGGGGGETYFDQLQLAITPTAGTGLFFFPADYETKQADDRMTHESLPPISKEKWIVQLFGRFGPRVPPPLGIPDEFEGRGA